MRTISLLLLTAFLAGCVASGPQYAESLIPHHDQAATVVVYRPNGFVGVVGSYDVKVDGESKCDLHNAAFFASPGHKGPVTVTSTRLAAIGTSKITINTEPNKTYYVRMENNDSKTAAVIGTGFVGLGLAEATSSSSGPFIFTLVDAQQAKQDLTGLRQSCI